jgi:3-phosphoshikimate 1-carboxyvinyltransferase
MDLNINPKTKLQGEITVPGDKSISHRSIMIGSLANGITNIKGFLMGDDCLNTINCFKKMGIPIEINHDTVTVHGKGINGLMEPQDILNVGNSGTTIRLLSGILAGQPFTAVITGDASIRKRPMGRIAEPLRKMGATILGRNNGELAPLTIRGGSLKPIDYKTPVASAQVKSAVLLAGLFAEGWTKVTEPGKSRDHTERMLKLFGAELETDGLTASVKGFPNLKGKDIQVPGDISSAAFFMVGAVIVPEGKITIKNVGLNPTRNGIIEVLQEMGAEIKINYYGDYKNYHNVNEVNRSTTGEPMGEVVVETSSLKGIKIGGSMIPRLVDEIPVIAVAAACADGITEIRDAQELKVKESNRLEAICRGLKAMGVDIEELPDGLRIKGGNLIKGNVELDSLGDHRIAMALAVAGLVASEGIVIKDAQSINVSFPGFQDILERLSI